MECWGGSLGGWEKGLEVGGVGEEGEMGGGVGSGGREMVLC